MLIMNILAIGAHPDDIELGCGGLLLKASRQDRHNIFMYTLTRGGASGDPEERTKELIQSAKFIGAQRLWIDNFEDTKLSLSSDLINHIEFFIKKADPDIVLTHSAGDTHHDHRAIAASTMEAGRFVPNILAYEIPVTRDFKPQVYYDISDVIDGKIDLINIFFSQRSKSFLQSNAIRGLAQYRALQSRFNNSVTCVEAFEVQKLFFGKDFKLLNIPQEKIARTTPQQMPREVIESITT
ncbi:MAG: PIG-L deacetylase family protein [Nitrososphaera sp.]|jgi:LmbE family N-acetylglucosaminyl deacetylase